MTIQLFYRAKKDGTAQLDYPPIPTRRPAANITLQGRSSSAGSTLGITRCEAKFNGDVVYTISPVALYEDLAHSQESFSNSQNKALVDHISRVEPLLARPGPLFLFRCLFFPRLRPSSTSLCFSFLSSDVTGDITRSMANTISNAISNMQKYV